MKKLVYLRTSEMDGYHRRRSLKHGDIYYVVRSIGDGAIYEAQSLATGAVCTLRSSFCVSPEDLPLDE